MNAILDDAHIVGVAAILNLGVIVNLSEHTAQALISTIGREDSRASTKSIALIYSPIHMPSSKSLSTAEFPLDLLITEHLTERSLDVPTYSRNPLPSLNPATPLPKDFLQNFQAHPTLHIRPPRPARIQRKSVKSASNYTFIINIVE